MYYLNYFPRNSRIKHIRENIYEIPKTSRTKRSRIKRSRSRTRKFRKSRSRLAQKVRLSWSDDFGKTNTVFQSPRRENNINNINIHPSIPRASDRLYYKTNWKNKPTSVWNTHSYELEEIHKHLQRLNELSPYVTNEQKEQIEDAKEYFERARQGYSTEYLKKTLAKFAQTSRILEDNPYRSTLLTKIESILDELIARGMTKKQLEVMMNPKIRRNSI